MTRWDSAMDRALDLARACGAEGETPVGAVVLSPTGDLLAEAGNRRERDADPTAHAEVLALRAAAQAFGDGWRLTGCTLVVTLEPCVMCAGAALSARVERIVFGAFDPKAGAVASLFDLARDPRLNHRIEITAGVREPAAAAALRDWFDARR